MVACRVDCGHRRFVLDYVRERDAQLVRAEAATAGNATELAAYFGTDGERDQVEQRWTWQQHMKVYSGTDYPYPRHRERDDDGPHEVP